MVHIFTNSRSGGSGKHYAIANGYGATLSSATGWAPNASDYNVLNANSATIGYMIRLNLNSLASATYVVVVCQGNGDCSSLRFVKE